MSEQLDEEEEMGVDNLGRKRKPKRGPIKFELQPRGDGESIEDWIKRETERLVLKSAICKDKREAIIRKDKERAEAGLEYARELQQKTHLIAERDKEIRAVKRKWKVDIDKQHRVAIDARTKKNKRATEHKTMLAKYNTLYNRYFNAVKVRVMQNMKSLCNIQHTWADKQTKRAVQNGEVNNKGNKPANKRAVSGIIAQVKEHAKKAGEI